MSDTARVDAWLWAIRIFKTRTLATDSCKAGHVKVNQASAKPSTTVKIGDEVRVRIDGFDRILKVQQTISKRVGAPLAAAAVAEITPPRDPVPKIAVRDRGAGRPTKRERREIDKLRGRDDH